MDNRHSRQSFLGETSEATIKNTTVAVIGLCGGGSHVSQQLAHIGVGKLVLVDGDFAEDSNRNRMVGLTYAEAQAEARKVDVISARVAAVSPETEIVKHDGPWNLALDDLKQVDYIFGCVDTMGARDELERFARRFRIPYIDVGMDVHGEEGRYFISGQVIASLPGQPCMRCMGFITDAALAAENARYGAAGDALKSSGRTAFSPRLLSEFLWRSLPRGTTRRRRRFMSSTTATGARPGRVLNWATCRRASVATWRAPKVRGTSSRGDCFVVSGRLKRALFNATRMRYARCVSN